MKLNYGPNFQYVNNDQEVIIDKTKIVKGISIIEDIIIVNQKNLKFYSNTCDHNFGKLLKVGQENFFRCPMHGWKFDPLSGFYDNGVKKNQLKYSNLANDKISLKIEKKFIKRLSSKDNSKEKIIVNFINHACIVIEYKNIKVAIDPWVKGTCFLGGWESIKDLTNDEFNLLNSCDYFFISHSHSDHCNFENLKTLVKDKKIIIPHFLDFNFSNYIKTGLDYDADIHEIEIGKRLSILPDMFFSFLKSGDFRNDTGFLIEINSKNILSAVDSNNLNSGVTPEKVDIYLSKFASGASGFPISFIDYDRETRKKMSKAKANVQKSLLKKDISRIKPNYFIPYAGFFYPVGEKSITDLISFNTVNDIKLAFKETKLKIIDPSLTSKIEILSNGEVKQKGNPWKKKFKTSSLVKEEVWCNEIDNLDDLIKSSQKFFTDISFKDNLIMTLEIINVGKKIKELKFDYRSNKNINDYRELKISVKGKKLKEFFKRPTPIEELFIGYHLNISRKPDIFNANFWHHFSNKSINRSTKINCYRCDKFINSIYK